MPITPGDTLVVNRFQATSNLARDEIVTTLAFQFAAVGGTPPTPGDRENLAQRLLAFWAGSLGADVFLSSYLSGWVSRTPNSAAIEQYAIPVAGPLGSPVHTLLFTPNPAIGAVSFPSEVSVHIELLGDMTGIPEEQGGIRPRGRRRGGPRFGPVNAACATDISGEPRVDINGEFGDDVEAAFEHINAFNSGLGTWHLSVYSRANNDLHHVVQAKLDDAFDTQRSRGRDETAARVIPLP